MNGWQCTKRTDRYLRVLALDSRCYVAGRQLILVELERIEPDAHGITRTEDVDAANTFKTFDLVLDACRENIAKVYGCTLAIGRNQGADHQDARSRTADFETSLLYDIRQLGLNKLELVLHLHLGNIRHDAVTESQGNGRTAGGRR
ncbi:hypothetical protein D3C80_1685670 [compost metagenome]